MTAAEFPLGEPVQFRGARRPGRAPLTGRYVLLRQLDPATDAGALYRISHPPHGDPGVWRYLFEGPYSDAAAMQQDLERQAVSADPVFMAVVPRTGVATPAPAGIAALMRIEPEHGCIEVGNIWFGPTLRRSTAATEAIYLLAQRAFDELGNRRLEWKCNALNAASRRAAERFGFRFEGVFLKHRVVKGRNRDTAWYAITEDRWPDVRAAFEAWLQPANFDAAGAQRRALREFMPPPG